MKNRSWICYTLDLLGVAALVCATGALTAVIWLNGSDADALILQAFKYSLMGSVAAFLIARVCEIVHIVRHDTPVPIAEVAVADDNVETLPAKGRLPRAA